MALTVAGRPVSPLTVDMAMAMLAAGIIPGDNRLELLDGVLTEKPVKGVEHDEVKRRLIVWLDPAANAARFDVLIEAGIVVPDRTGLPEPDVMVVTVDRDRLALVTAALLVVEVAVTTQATDLGRKVELYAAAQVPEYWVVDVPARSVVRLTGPDGHGYARREVVAPPAALSPIAFRAAPLELSGLFAG